MGLDSKLFFADKKMAVCNQTDSKHETQYPIFLSPQRHYIIKKQGKCKVDSIDKHTMHYTVLL